MRPPTTVKPGYSGIPPYTRNPSAKSKESSRMRSVLTVSLDATFSWAPEFITKKISVIIKLIASRQLQKNYLNEQI